MARGRPRQLPPPEGSTNNNDNNDNTNANSVQQLVDLLSGALANRSQTPHVTSFKDFKAVGPPEFRGSMNPIEAQTWIMETEKVFDVARVGDDQKTAFATFMLKSDASYWWQANKVRGGQGVVTWERFKEMFFEMYFPDSARNKMEVQFLELKQNNMTVPEYAARFNELARFAIHQVSTDERKARRFEQGLKPWLYSKVSMFQVNTFAGVLEKAIIAEGGSDALTKYNQEQKKKKDDKEFSRGSNSTGGGNNHKRKWNDSESTGNQQNSQKEQVEACVTCGKNHTGVCLKGKRICFNCRQEGHIAPNCPKLKTGACFICGSLEHMARNCPKKSMGGSGAGGNRGNSGGGTLTIPGSAPTSRPIARTFNMTVQDAVQSRDVVSGIIPINSINAYVSFDSGATCSFISDDYAKNLELPKEELKYPMNIEITNREIIFVRFVHKNCKVEIKGNTMTVDLIPIKLGEFEVIFGLDWLFNYGR